jgi:hypothetical protein
MIKALFFPHWDRVGKDHPDLKIFLNNDLIIDNIKSRLSNTLEPIFGMPINEQIREMENLSKQLKCGIGIEPLSIERIVEIENRWFSSHRAKCGCPK